MVKYVFLVYRDEKRLDAMSPSVRAMFEEACRANEQDLRDNGHLYASEDLQNNNITVQFVNGNVTITDGPAGLTTGLSIQLYFIDARDLNAAIQIASQIPQTRAGLVEVRPILALDSGSVPNS